MTGRRTLSTKYGQVFLTSIAVAEREVALLGGIEGKNVLEIGCGGGILTGMLLEKNCRLTGIEPDHTHFGTLSAKFSAEISSGRFDLLKTTFGKLEHRDFDFIIGNIPYSHSSEILFGLREFGFQKAVLMVQKEFGLRMVAQPGTGDYCRLTVNTALSFHVSMEFEVSRSLFEPVPQVDSVVVSITHAPMKPNVDSRKADMVIRKIFSNRRKMLGNIFMGVPDELKKARGEMLTPQQILDLAEILNS
ncbi:MAG: 16S rRNA (adenine(1518)-N(6)/adenine(1519)-N(6))-dimethyltransferase RsmA [Candidatus Thermoplasmatota archaeon]|nr:16S rRNA (adenine(1518)-N(6)/adenine(1519)-N(6))-dimethyltransferase RsmA [Candidatus Thermoplasmatota archaeon]